MNTKKVKVGILCGVIAGIIDVIPMIIQGLTWDANISAFLMWIMIGFFISTTSLEINQILKGTIIAFLVLIPALILIAWADPFSILPIVIMTVILGSLLGYCIEKFGNE